MENERKGAREKNSIAGDKKEKSDGGNKPKSCSFPESHFMRTHTFRTVLFLLSFDFTLSYNFTIHIQLACTSQSCHNKPNTKKSDFTIQCYSALEKGRNTL